MTLLGRRRDHLLLRAQRKALGHRPAGHRLGALPDAGQHPGCSAKEARSQRGERRLACCATPARAAASRWRIAGETGNRPAAETFVADKVYNVLFICTGNSARSILAEALLNHAGRGPLQGVLRGQPSDGRRQSTAPCEALRSLGVPADRLHAARAGTSSPRPAHRRWTSSSRSATAPPVRSAPSGRASPMTAHWGMPDPAAVRGTAEETRAAFRDAAITLKRRIELMLALPPSTLDSMASGRELRDIGER